MNLPKGIVQIIPIKDREMVTHMLKGLDGAIDVIVPRGGKSLVQAVQDSATIPFLVIWRASVIPTLIKVLISILRFQW